MIDEDEWREMVETESKQAAEELARDAFSRSIEILYEEGDKRQWEVYPIAQSGHPPVWDETRQAFVFGFDHLASAFFEYGTEPHEIEPKEADALRWFDPSGDPVFAQHVDHPGTPALRFVQRGLEQA